MKLFLDDIRTPAKTTHVVLPRGEWKIVRNYDAFCNAINNHWQEFGCLPEFISFDHDLNQEHYHVSMNSPDYNLLYPTFKEKTGLHCANWLVQFCLDKNVPIPDYMVHSMNPVGKQNIIFLLENVKKYQNESH